MKKKILFILPTLAGGGAEKSLTTLLQLFDYDKYEVDLFLLRRAGLFLDNVPSEVNILDAGELYDNFANTLGVTIRYAIKKLNPAFLYHRIMYIINHASSDTYKQQKKAFEHFSYAVRLPDKQYDCAVGYLEGFSNSLAAYATNAKRKIGYIHSDFDKLNFDLRATEQCFENLDKVVTVSEKCLEILQKNFPNMKDKFTVIENITSKEILLENAKKGSFPEKDKSTKTILTVGRMDEEKAIDLAVKACRVLKDKNINFKWYHIGSGSLEKEIRALIDELEVADRFILLGTRSNPYAYIEGCDIYVQPSRFEGKSIAIDEAKCFAKPIVVTNFTTVYDQLTHEKTATICEMNENSMADAIIELINDEKKAQLYRENLLAENCGNEQEIEKFYLII